MDPALWRLLEAGGREDEVAAIIRLRDPGVIPPGVRVVSQFGSIATVRLQREGIVETRADEATFSFKAPVLLTPDVEESEPYTSASLPLEMIPGVDERRSGLEDPTGARVDIGIVDWGFDFAHPDFRNPDGTTRLLALWDQQNESPGGENRYGYGRIYSQAEINQALQAPDPYKALGYDPADSDPGRGAHATHVAGIAAGNGRSGGPLGVAPEANLIFVQLGTWEKSGVSRLGDSVTLLEAVDFISRTAGDRPWVINLSMGKQAGEHDGLSPVEQGLDAAISAAPGRFICQSTGNYYDRRVHSYVLMRPGEERVLNLLVEQAALIPQEVEIWYPGRDRLLIEVCSPGREVCAQVRLGEQASLKLEGREVAKAYHRASDPNNLDHEFELFILPHAPAGEWEIRLYGEDVVDGRVHAWIERDAVCAHCQPQFDLQDVVPSTTTGSICNGFYTVAVGAYNPHTPTFELGSFSSAGPTRDGRERPNLVAPGVDILSARSHPRGAGPDAPLLTRMRGTSMAAPHVTGTVALMFETAWRPLLVHETRSLLLTSTDPVDASPNQAIRIGSGRLNIAAAVEAVREYNRRTRRVAERPREKRQEAEMEQAVTQPEIDESMSADGQDNGWTEIDSLDTEDFADGLSSLTFADAPPAPAWMPEWTGAMESAAGEAEAEAVERDALEPDALEGALAMPEDMQAAEEEGAVAEDFAGPEAGRAEMDDAWEDSEDFADGLCSLTFTEAEEPPAWMRGPLELQDPALASTETADEAAIPHLEDDRGKIARRRPVEVEPPGEQAWEAAEVAPGAAAISTASRAIQEQTWGHAALLGHVAESGTLGSGTQSGPGGRFPSPAEIYEAFTSPYDRGTRAYLEQFFDVLALPGTRLAAVPRHGDVIVRRGVGPGHAALVAREGLWTADALPEDILPETARPGRYVQVVEGGMFPHVLEQGFARLVTDVEGRVPRGQLLLRPKRLAAEQAAWEADLQEAGWEEDGAEWTQASPGLFSAKAYTTDWTIFMPFTLNGAPHYVAYKQDLGWASIDRIRPGASRDPATGYPVDTLYSSMWTTGWTAFVPFRLPGKKNPFYLAYKAVTGEVTIDQIPLDGKGVDTIWGSSLDPAVLWSSCWTSFVPFELGGQPHYLAYKAASGDVAIDRIKPDGKGVDTVWGTPLDAKIRWDKGWTSFVPFTLDGKPFYLAYKVGTGEVKIDMVHADGKGVDTVWGTLLDPNIRWTTGWTHFAPFQHPDGWPHYIAYKVDTGKVNIDRIRPVNKSNPAVGMNIETHFKGYWAPGWTTLMPFQMNKEPHLFAYRRSTGWVSVSKMLEEMKPRCSEPHITFDPAARDVERATTVAEHCLPSAPQHFLVGTTEYDAGTKVILGDTYHIKGTVYYPAQTSGVKKPFTNLLPGGAPIVFMAHGNHDPASPSHLGYAYFQEQLAKMGIVAVSVYSNETNGLDGDAANIRARAELINAGIAHLQSLHKGGDPLFGGKIDFSRTALMGHSRGAEAVLLAPEILAIAGVSIKAVLSVAPTDYGSFTGTPKKFAFMTILPAADGDVVTNDGAKYYDRATPDSFKVQLYIHQANHNYFNTEWTNDDTKGKLTVMPEADHRSILSAYGAAFYRVTLLYDDISGFLNGRMIPSGVQQANVHLSFQFFDSTIVDNYEGHSVSTNSLGKAVTTSNGLTAAIYPFSFGTAGAYNQTFFGSSNGLVAKPSSNKSALRSELDKADDLTTSEIWVRCAEVYTGSVVGSATGFQLGLEDNAGTVVWVDVAEVGGLPRPFERSVYDIPRYGVNLTKTMLKMIRFPAGCFARDGLKLSKIRAIRVRLHKGDGKSLAFDDILIV